MRSIPWSHSLNNWISLAGCALLVSGCSTIGDAMFGRESEPAAAETSSPAAPGPQTEIEKALSNLPSSKYEWAVQSFEAGQYETALEKFSALELDGANVASFELIPFYIGMSHFQLSHLDGAISYLKKFLAGNGKRSEADDARIALLLAYEKKGAWSEITAVAGEMQESFTNAEDRILLRLVWAEALVRQGEYPGARQILRDAETGMGNIPFTGLDADLTASAGEDLQGRFAWLKTKSELAECSDRYPMNPDAPAKKGAKKKEKGPNLAHRLEGKSECLEKALARSLENYAFFTPAWSGQIADTLRQGLESFVAEATQPAPGRIAIVKPILQRAFYRIAAQLQNRLGTAEMPQTTRKPLEDLGKSVESLLQRVSLLSYQG